MADKILEPDTSLTESERIMALTKLLKPCPCCGGAAHVRTPSFGWIGEIGKFSIVCSNSDWCGFGTSEHDELLYAVEEWNRRTDYQL
ncbi:MAG: Lar family restriction alleviation protein [Synergistaceae bacterium]|nr:Lar family restriction alleviation protein [Synergistaceae bacterium]